METVRACLRAGKLAHEVDFFSFGTNDLTQAVFSFSREDVERKFLTTYLELGILQHNPFEILDIKGVGRLMETTIWWARQAKKTLEITNCQAGSRSGSPQTKNKPGRYTRFPKLAVFIRIQCYFLVFLLPGGTVRTGGRKYVSLARL